MLKDIKLPIAIIPSLKREVGAKSPYLRSSVRADYELDSVQNGCLFTSPEDHSFELRIKLPERKGHTSV